MFCPSYPISSPLSRRSTRRTDNLSYGTVNKTRHSLQLYYNPIVPPGTGARSAGLSEIQSGRRRHTFIMDYIDTQMNTPGYFAHQRSKGWNMVFTDGSTMFSKPDPETYQMIAAGGYPATSENSPT